MIVEYETWFSYKVISESLYTSNIYNVIAALKKMLETLTASHTAGNQLHLSLLALNRVFLCFFTVVCNDFILYRRNTYCNKPNGIYDELCVLSDWY